MHRFGRAAVLFGAGAACATALILPAVHRRLTARVVVADLREVARLGTPGDDGTGAVECWGDSLTKGAGAAPGHDFPDLVAYLFDRRVANRGVSGETSAQIAARMLARPPSPRPERAVIWAGRNDDFGDPSATERNIGDMVASLPAGSRFLVLGIPNGDTRRERRGGDRYEAIRALNERLRARYGGSYVPIREILVAQARPGDAEDQDAAEADVVPPSLRADALHLNDRGQAVVAYAVEQAMRAAGW